MARSPIGWPLGQWVNPEGQHGKAVFSANIDPGCCQPWPLPGWLAGQAERYGQALAAGSRKLALLIGINRYPGEGSALQGCVTDVELQRELLLNRFGFDPAEILTLTDGAATPSGIQAAFAEHLGGSSQAAETVVVQFSGYGQWRAGSAPGQWQPVLLLSGSEGMAAMELDSFFRLLEGLGTAQITTLLDCGFTHISPSVRGNLQLRSRPQPGKEQNLPPQTPRNCSGFGRLRPRAC